MQIYDYKAKDNGGNAVSGKVEARDKEQAVRILRDRDLVIISLKSQAESSGLGDLFSFMNKVKADDIVAFTSQLATMINAGLPINDAFNLLRVQSKPQLARVIDDIMRDIEGGSTLADAMKSHREVFSDVYIALVRAGEASGKLDEVLNRLAETEEKRQEFRSKTKGALVYPAVVVLAMIAVGIIMFVFVIPEMRVIYDDFGADLPFVTEVLLGISELVAASWWLGIILAGLGLWGLRQWYKTDKGKHVIDRKLLELPILGNLQAKIILTEFSRTLALLVRSGISIIRALEIVAASTSNVVLQDAVKSAAQGVEKGMPLAAMMAREQIFPPLLPQMISVGEETGRLDDVLLKVSEYFERESEQLVKNLTTMIEPIIMIVLGVGVGFMIMAIIVPIYNLTGQF